jgi:tetratricopeptide (TPR) repeat protein
MAILGNPETLSGDAGDALRERIAVASQLDEEAAQECHDLLAPDALGGGSDVENLQALCVLGLAQPELAQRNGLDAGAYGRALAERLEGLGREAEALAMLRLLSERFPWDAAVENDLTAFLGRQGMVQELADRYLGYANQLLEEGRVEDALPWLKEVLLLDRSRTDIACMIRDLRYQEVHAEEVRGRRLRVSAVALIVSLVLFSIFFHEYSVRQAWRALPSGEAEDLAGLRARLSGLEGFIGDHPVWTGSLGAIQERAQLRAEVEIQEEELAREAERREQELAERKLEVEMLRHRGLRTAERGDLVGAQRDLSRALELASSDWPHRERVTRDVNAIAAYLAENEEQGQ